MILSIKNLVCTALALIVSLPLLAQMGSSSARLSSRSKTFGIYHPRLLEGPSPLSVVPHNLYFVTTQGTPSYMSQQVGDKGANVLVSSAGLLGTRDYTSLAVTGEIRSAHEDAPLVLNGGMDWVDKNAMIQIHKGNQDGQGSVQVLSSPSLKPGSDRFDGLAFVVHQFDDTYGPNPEDHYRPIFMIDKQGDVVLGDTRKHSSWPGITIDRNPGGAGQWAAGTRLFFSGDENLYGDPNVHNNLDPIFIHRFNENKDKSTLRVCLSDDGTGPGTSTEDKMEIGYYDQGGYGKWMPGAAIYASGEVFARKVKVTLSDYPDYVFKPGYKLASLAEVERHIQTQGHLPGFKPAAQVEKEGMDLGEQNRLLVEKVEELTLHLIRMQKELDALKTAK